MMNITIRNSAKLSNKYVRFIKWKLYGAKEKFNHLLYAEVHLNTEGQSPKIFNVNIRLGISGNDIIIQHQSRDLKAIFKKSTTAIHRYLEKNKPVKKQSNEILN